MKKILLLGLVLALAIVPTAMAAECHMVTSTYGECRECCDMAQEDCVEDGGDPEFCEVTAVYCTGHCHELPY